MKTHPDYAATCQNIAVVHHGIFLKHASKDPDKAVDSFSEAYEHYRHASDVYEVIGGANTDDPKLAIVFNSLATLCFELATSHPDLLDEDDGDTPKDAGDEEADKAATLRVAIKYATEAKTYWMRALSIHMKREKKLGNTEGGETRKNLKACIEFLDDPEAAAAAAADDDYDDRVEECLNDAGILLSLVQKTFSAIGLDRKNTLPVFSEMFDRAMEHLMEEKVGVDLPAKSDVQTAMKSLEISEVDDEEAATMLSAQDLCNITHAILQALYG